MHPARKPLYDPKSSCSFSIKSRILTGTNSVDASCGPNASAKLHLIGKVLVEVDDDVDVLVLVLELELDVVVLVVVVGVVVDFVVVLVVVVLVFVVEDVVGPF